MFGSKKKSEEELQSERELHQKLEERIREVLILTERPQLEAVEVREPIQISGHKSEIELFPIMPPAASEPEEEPDYTYLHPSTPVEFLRKSPSRYRPAMRRFASGRASQTH
jgi:hypothetical protein